MGDDPLAGYAAALDNSYREERELCENLASIVAFQRTLIPSLGISLIRLQDSNPPLPDLPPLDPAEFIPLFPPGYRQCATDRDLYFGFVHLVNQKLARGVLPDIYDSFRRCQHSLIERLLARRLHFWGRLSGSRVIETSFPPDDSRNCEVKSTITAEAKDVSAVLLRQAQRIVLNDKEGRLRQFSPDAEALRWIEEQAGSDLSLEKMTALLGDARKTHEELLPFVAELEGQQQLAELEQQFPPPSAVADFQRYKDLSDQINRKLLEVRTGLFNFQSEYSAVIAEFKEMSRQFEKGFAIPRVKKELEKLHELNREDKEQALRHRELLVVRQVIEHTKIRNPHPWTARDFVEGELKDFDRAVELARENKFDSALEVVGAEFDKYSDIERLLKEERDAVLAAKARAETERNNWYGKKTKPHDRQLQVQLAEMKTETEKQYKEFEEIKADCERKMEDALAKVTEAVRKIQRATLLPQNFEAGIKVRGDARARRDWLLARIQEAGRRRDDLRKKNEQTKGQTKRALEETEELKKQFQTLAEKSQTQQPVDEALDQKYQEYHDAYHCQQCLRLGHRRPRDSVLAKCGHSYCKDCIDQLVKNRNRKCPVCTEPFDPMATSFANRVIEIKWPKERLAQH
jgi:hypothetical protein